MIWGYPYLRKPPYPKISKKKAYLQNCSDGLFYYDWMIWGYAYSMETSTAHRPNARLIAAMAPLRHRLSKNWSSARIALAADTKALGGNHGAKIEIWRFPILENPMKN